MTVQTGSRDHWVSKIIHTYKNITTTKWTVQIITVIDSLSFLSVQVFLFAAQYITRLLIRLINCNEISRNLTRITKTLILIVVMRYVLTDRSMIWVSGSGSVEEAPKFYFPPQGAFRSPITRTRLANPPSPSAASSKTTPGPVRRSWTPMASWCPPFLIWGTPCRYKREHLAKHSNLPNS